MHDEILVFWGYMEHPTFRGTGRLLRANIKCRPASCIPCLVFIPIFRTCSMHGSKLSLVLLSHFSLPHVYIIDVKWWRMELESTKKRRLLAIILTSLNFKVLVLIHLWTDCLEILHGRFFGHTQLQNFEQHCTMKIYLLGDTWNTLVYIYIYIYIYIYQWRDKVRK